MKNRIPLKDVPWIQLSFEYAVINLPDGYIILEARRSYDDMKMEECLEDIGQINNELLIEMRICTQHELDEFYRVRNEAREKEIKRQKEKQDKKEYVRLKNILRKVYNGIN